MTMHQGLDLSRFKRVSSDKKTTTLRHAKGHEIKIAHSGLTPKMREHIDSLAMANDDGEEPQRFAEGTPDEPVAADPQMAEAQPQQALQQPMQQQPMPQAAAPQQPMPQQGMPQAPAKRPAYNPINPEELRQQNALWQQDLANGHIQPKTYHDLFAKKDTLGKVGTLFGLMISGAGAGLTHQPNAVMEMMNKEIENDLDAQKQSKTNARNFLDLNRQMTMDQAQIARLQQEGVLSQAQVEKIKLEGGFTAAQIDKLKHEGHLTDAQAHSLNTEAAAKAYALSRMQMNSAALHNLVDQVNKMPVGSPQRLQAEQQLALLSKGIEGENYNIADKAAVAGALSSMAFGQGGTQSDNPESGFQQGQTALRVSGNEPLANDREGKHMPGLEGSASIPLTPGDREEINSGIQFQDQLKRFTDWTKKHSGDLSPSERNEGQALAAQLQGSYRMATKGGVYKEGEQGFISSIIDSTPTKFFNDIRVLPQLEAVQKESSAQLNQLVKSKGFKGYKGPSATDKFEGKTIVDKNGNRQIRKGGKWVPVEKTKQAKK